MCGICGYIYLGEKGRSPAPDLKAMNATLAHRGPDGDGFYRDDAVGLGNRRLMVIDPEGGWQPLYNESRDIAAVFNGEIYNHRELRLDLQSRGHRFLTGVDTEIIPHQYEEDGDRCLEKFNGMFTFALWDRNAGRLLLARDRLGIKPLYWALDQGRLFFGSEIKAIIAGMGRPPEMDAPQLYHLLKLQYIPGASTPFKGIRRLAPGHLLVVEGGEVSERPYWSLPAPGASEAPDKENFKGRFLSLLEDSVRLRLISDVPLGVFLSGGMDSTVIVALMKKLVGREAITTFSVDFEGGGRLNETPYAEYVSRTFETRHFKLTVRPADLERLLSVLPFHLDDPITDPAVIPTYMVSSLAKEKATVVLSGEGADEIFGGYLRYSLGEMMGRADGTAARAASGAAGRVLAGLPRTARMVKALRASAAGDETRRHLELISAFSGPALSSLFRNGLSGEEEEIEFFGRRFGASSCRGVNRVLEADLVSWLPDDLLAKVDRMSMAVSLEARVPYLDHRLVGLAMAIPPEWKVNKMKRKIFFKEAVKGLIPDGIINRPKRGFELPLRDWFRGPLRPLVEKTLDREKVESAGLLSHQGVRDLVQRHMDGLDDLSLQVWSLMVLQKWLERYGQGAGA